MRVPPPVTFRLTESMDPEELLEEAAVWKALYDVSGGTATAVKGQVPTTFGRLRRSEAEPPLEYWSDPAFLIETQREFFTCSLKEAVSKVAELHERGKDAFVKSTKFKHAIFRCPVGSSLETVMGDMVYSFIDNGPLLMVQELVSMTFEWRFFCVDRKIVADGNNHPSLTPLDFPLNGRAYRTPQDTKQATNFDVITTRGYLQIVAERIARTMREPNAVIDCAYISGKAGCVELNPLRLGQVGLFACDVKTLVTAVYNDYIKQYKR